MTEGAPPANRGARASAAFTADVAVIGAGIVGAAAAFRLAEAGLRTVILEAQPAPATGSTGRSAAGVRVQFGEPLNVLLSWESIREYRDFEELYGRPSGYDPLGYLFLVPREAQRAHLHALEMQQSYGLPVVELSPLAAQQLVPFAIDDEATATTTWGKADGIVDPHAITLAYLEMARELGATLHTSTPVVGASFVSDAWRLNTPAGAVEASHVVCAAGAWSGSVAASAGLSLPVQPVLRSVYVTSPTPTAHRYPLTIDLSSGVYLRSEGPRVIFGRSNREQPLGFHEGVDFADLDRVLWHALVRFPWLADAGLDRRASWWGYYEVTPDESPVLGRMPEVAPGASRWLNACGFSGHGVQQAARVGRLIVEEIERGRVRTIDIDPFRYDRFLSPAPLHANRESHIV